MSLTRVYRTLLPVSLLLHFMDYILNRGVGGGIGGGFGSMLRQSMCRCLPYGNNNNNEHYHYDGNSRLVYCCYW